MDGSAGPGPRGPDLGIHLGMSGRIVVVAQDGWVAEGGDRAGPGRAAAQGRVGPVHARVRRRRPPGAVRQAAARRILLNPDIDALGPDAAEVTPAQFRALITKGTIAVKARLLDQSKIAGIGNLLADEILWQAKIPPAHAGQPPAAQGRRPAVPRAAVGAGRRAGRGRRRAHR